MQGLFHPFDFSLDQLMFLHWITAFPVRVMPILQGAQFGVQTMKIVPPLAVVATCVMVTEFVPSAEIYGTTVAAAAKALVAENVQCDEAVAPVTVNASEVAVV